MIAVTDWLDRLEHEAPWREIEEWHDILWPLVVQAVRELEAWDVYSPTLEKLREAIEKTPEMKR